MIACATRPREALNARWEEFDLDRKLWTIPAARMKSRKGKGKPHSVPLSSIATDVLERQARVTGGVGPIFPGKLKGRALTYCPFATAKMVDVDGNKIDAGSPHGWRSVFRDACDDKLRIDGRRVDPDLAETALAHTLSAVEGAYRRETAIEDRRSVMEAYWLMGKSDNNVVKYPERAA